MEYFRAQELFFPQTGEYHRRFLEYLADEQFNQIGNNDFNRDQTQFNVQTARPTTAAPVTTRRPTTTTVSLVNNACNSHCLSVTAKLSGATAFFVCFLCHEHSQVQPGTTRATRSPAIEPAGSSVQEAVLQASINSPSTNVLPPFNVFDTEVTTTVTITAENTEEASSSSSPPPSSSSPSSPSSASFTDSSSTAATPSITANTDSELQETDSATAILPSTTETVRQLALILFTVVALENHLTNEE